MSTITIQSNNLSNIRAGELRATYNAAGTRILRYHIDLTHKLMNLHKEISATEIEILQQKVNILLTDWDRRYAGFLLNNRKANGKALADEATIEAESNRVRLRNLLKDTLSVDDALDWGRLKPRDRYLGQAFPKRAPSRPTSTSLPPQPKITFIDKLFGGAKRKREQHDNTLRAIAEGDAAADARYEQAYTAWTAEKDSWDAAQERNRAEHNSRQATVHAEVDRLQAAWVSGEPSAIIEHANLVLEASKYPDVIPKDFDITWDVERQLMLVDYSLPLPDALPLAKTVRFNPASGELTESKISKTEAKDLYDAVCYQICLRTIHELFEADSHGHIKAVAFNGIARSIDPATGNEAEAVLMSILVTREQFLSINLANVDPKACFKNLRGVSAASLIGLAPVPPVIKMDKKDRRFIEGRQVDLGDEGAVNLAAISWEDFEHLVRELFEREFSSRGGEVRVTQASSDGGVDAVAFDPDPISGGKIVIQAKRYTRTVGVSAVRDLYGTAQAEGATKGILVTTADYGPDAYRFAQGKPITLMTGANLLHLLEKHGMRAKIDLAQARKDLGLSSRM